MKDRYLEKRKYSDRRESIIRAVQKRRRKIREMAVSYKGGKCERCGYNRCLEALDFHHTDTTKKDFGISSKGYTRSWKKVQEELDKCIMICANCHREVHAELAALSRNARMTSGLSQGSLKSKDHGNPELPQINGGVQRLYTRYPLVSEG